MRSIPSFSAWLRFATAAGLVMNLSASGTRVFAAGHPAQAAAGQAQPSQPQTSQPQTATVQGMPEQPSAPSGPVRRMSVDDAVAMALDQNLNLRAARLDPQIQDLAVAQARAAFAPIAFSTVSTGSNNSPLRNPFQSTNPKITTDTFTTSLGVRQNAPWGGGQYELSWNGGRTETNSFSQRNPELSSGLDARLTQPLLRNFKIDSLRQQVLLNNKQREISDITLRQSIAQTTRNVRNAYWDLVAAIANHNVQQQSLQLARESLRNNRTRVEVGTMAPIDIVEAEAEVARNEEAVIVSEASIRTAEDRLRAQIADPGTTDFWTTRIEPTDQPIMAPPRPIDVDTAVANALQNRTDILQTRKQLESADLNIRFYSNQRLPDVNLEATYGLTGLGGTENTFGSGFPPPVLNQTSRSFGSVLSDVFGNDFPRWTVGVTVGYPIGQSQAEANLARSRLENTQAQTTLRNQELQVTTAVRESARQVNTNLKRVQATQVARQLAEQRLQAEQKKFNVGMSTTFIVFQAQRELTAARNAELRAVIDYNRSIVDFEAIQVIPLSGGGSVSVVQQ